jgi:hypothetical protein
VSHEVGHGGEVVPEAPAEGDAEALALGAGALVAQAPGGRDSEEGGQREEHTHVLGRHRADDCCRVYILSGGGRLRSSTITGARS